MINTLQGKAKMGKSKNLFSKIVAVLATIINLLFFVFLFRHDILPIKLRIILLVVFALLLAYYLYLAFKKEESSKGLVVLAILFIITSIGEGIFYSYANKSIQTVNKINEQADINNSQMSFVVLKDSDIDSLEEAADYEIAISEDFDGDNSQKAIDEYKNKFDNKLNTVNLGNYLASAQSLIDGQSQVILLNEGYRQLIEESIQGFSDKTRVLESVVVKGKEVKEKQRKKVGAKYPFNVYISGIDTYGSLSKLSRSDVNLVVSVNPGQRKVLITTIPRDTYLPLGGDEDKYDKLTHAGLFGVDTSIKSLENLLDIEIDYYGRVNFTTVTQLVDVIGGITVENPVAFDAGKYNFPQGNVDMDGAMALAYSRERYSLAEGDFDRGKNQTRVMTGIIKKMLRPEILLNFNQISEIALQSVNTDMPYAKMIQLVNYQIEDSRDWSIETQALEGSGASGLPSYLMPNADLYMMKPNEDSIKEVKEKIEENNQVKED